MEKYFNLHKDCLLIDGCKNSIIHDSSRQIYKLVSIEVSRLIKKGMTTSIEKLKSESESSLQVISILNELTHEGYGLISNSKSPNISGIKKNETNLAHVSNAVIFLNPLVTSDFIFYLSNLKCESVLFIIDDGVSASNFNTIYTSVDKSTITSVQLMVNKNSLANLSIDLYSKLTHLTVFSSNMAYIDLASFTYYFLESKATLAELIENNKKSTFMFSINRRLINEAQFCNPYFVNKLYVDKDGNIRNSSELVKVFGNIKNINSSKELLSIISQEEFENYWFVHKGLIDVCKVCEYRLMCVDNRVPQQRSEHEWFFTSECNYNPFIAKWEGEEDYKSLNELKINSDEYGFSMP